MDDTRVRIDGIIAIEPPVDLDDAEVEVLLRDSAMADAPIRIIARTTMRRSGCGLNEIAFRLEASVDPHRSYCIAAEVRRGAVLKSGDLLSVVTHPWFVGDEGPVRIDVKRIR